MVRRGFRLRFDHAVGQKLPNPWGLSDMHGNVWEWIQDWFNEDSDVTSPSVDPAGPTTESARFVRGEVGTSPRAVGVNGPKALSARVPRHQHWIPACHEP